MIYIGFGFLMVFLKEHSWTSVGYNFLIAAYTAQITLLAQAFWGMALVDGEFTKVTVELPKLITADFGAAVILISFGAILGRCNLPQLWLLATLEVIFYTFNITLCEGVLEASDRGGSMYVHAFGAYFGLAASYHFYRQETREHKAGGNNLCEGGYTSQTIAMAGTLFLWMFWPSFNSALAFGSTQHRVICNTVMSISASCISACSICRMLKGKLNMEVVINATLAGGVAIGTASDLVTTPAVAILVGIIAGVLSAIGFLKLSGWFEEKIGLYDTCGVNNLHGMPGILGGLVGMFCCYTQMATSDWDQNTVALHN